MVISTLPAANGNISSNPATSGVSSMLTLAPNAVTMERGSSRLAPARVSAAAFSAVRNPTRPPSEIPIRAAAITDCAVR
jgi:hypothetical protein